MELASTLRMALRALARNKMRTVLTMLGIVIGVGAVIAMVGIGQGADQTMQDQIANLGSTCCLYLRDRAILAACTLAGARPRASYPKMRQRLLRNVLTWLR